MRRIVVLGIALFIVLASGAALVRAQSGPGKVNFASLDPSVRAPLTAALYRPAGSGPFPAMVLLHSCAGVQPHEEQWARWFAGKGYVALVVDSFAARGVRSVCAANAAPTMHDRAFDAYGALAYLRGRSDVDPQRIGAIGWSHGGGTAVWVDNAAVITELQRAPSGGPFRAVVALYPPCQTFGPLKTPDAPLLVLVGSADDWTPPLQCEHAVDALVAAGAVVSLHEYPGATHAFDNTRVNGQYHFGTHVYTLIYDPKAADDAHQRVAAFLTEALK